MTSWTDIDFGLLRRDVAAVFDEHRRSARCVYNGERSLIFCVQMRPGGSEAQLHVHEHSDQLYFVTRGELHIQAGDEVRSAGPETVVYIPRGIPHRAWNEGHSLESHIELLGPAPPLAQAITTPTDSTQYVGEEYLIKSASEASHAEPTPGYRVRRMLGRDERNARLTVNLFEVDPGREIPPLHVHEVDQYFHILEGEMTVKAVAATFVARAGDVVVLPAGVPHIQYNRGAVLERHVAMMAPAPMAGRPWDYVVAVTATGEAHAP